MDNYIIFEKGSGNHKYKAKIYDAKTDEKIKTVNFGAKKKPKGGYYRQYEDNTGLGLYSELDYKGDLSDAEANKKRTNYRKRHKKIMKKVNGEKVPAYKVPYTSAWLSWHFLWN